MEHQISTLRSLFKSRFDGEPRIFRAPGRINLIGEHTDYNDGFVLPAAIDLQTVAACTARGDRRIAVYAADKKESAEFDLDSGASGEAPFWLKYVEGTIRILDANTRIARGANIVFSSTVPIGAGMSSSAALEMVIGYALLGLNNIAFDQLDLAKAGQRAEHDYVGTRSGIMDQYASVFGRTGSAILLDCRDLDAKYIPIDFRDVSLIVCDSGVHHELASNEYNRRREECEEAVKAFRTRYPGVTHLRDVAAEHLHELSGRMASNVFKRARHVIAENVRTVEAANALSTQDVLRFGQLMFESHESLREDYEVSCRELDLLVESARDVEGVFGSRMMGGGFGGSTITLVSQHAKDTFFETVSQNYFRDIRCEPTFYEVNSADGASEIT